MKKVMKSMVLGSLAAAMLASGAAAANFTSSADVLNELGLFQGSESGYELDRAPDRAEAATMLVRLLGKEAEAKSFWQGMTNPQPVQQVEAASAYTLLDNELGVAMQGNTLYVADKDKLMTKAAEEGMMSEFDYEGYTKMMWAPIGVTVPEGAVKATFSYDGMEGEPVEIDLTKNGDTAMMHVEDGKLMYYVGVVAEKDGKTDLWPEETIVTKHFVWLDKNGTVLGETNAALNWSHTAPTAETTESAKPVEESTAAKDYVFPFTDMDNGYEWAKPYVAWLYNEGLTSGATATTFEPGNKCTAQQYTTFLMRALGYSDAAGGDFTYDNAIAFATEKGVVDAYNMDADNFLRDDVVAMSYTALSAAPKSGETDLLTKLVNEGAIEAETAAPVQQTFTTLRNFNKAYEAVAATTSADATADFTMNMSVADATVDASGKFDVQVKADPANLADMQMAMTGSLSMSIPATDGAEAATLELPMEMYVQDGVSYTNVMGVKVKQDLDLDSALKGIDLQALADMNTVPLCMLDSISQDGNTYKMSYNSEAFNGLFAEIFSQITDQIEITDEMKAQGITEDMFKISVDLTKADVEMTFKDGGLYDQKADMAMTMDMMGEQVSANIVMNMSATAVGDAVTVEYPSDLDTYVDASEVTADTAADPAAETAAEEIEAAPTAETTDASADAALATDTVAE
mgnify:CR=1 FL=1